MPIPRPSAPGEPGFITIVTVIVLTAVGIATLLGLFALLVGETDAEIIRSSGLRAEWLADACAEHARGELRSVLGYSGNETLSFGDDSCEVGAVTQVGGGLLSPIYEVPAEGISGGAVARVAARYQVTLALLGGILDVQEVVWQRVSDF